MSSTNRQLLFSVTAADMRWDYFNGTGNGGQNRNKTSSCVRCHHDPSGAIGTATEERSQSMNKAAAFRRCVESKKFRDWQRLEAARRLGTLASVDEVVDRQMKQIVTEVRRDGKWTKITDEKELDNLATEQAD